jgi:transcriptional regulator with XRE-family HTH domain
MAAESTFLAVLGRRIRRLRLLAELTQAELAAATGMSRSFVSLIENGDCSLQVVRLLRIADALRVPPTALLSDPQGCADPGFCAAGEPLVRRDWTSAADPETQTYRSAR